MLLINNTGLYPLKEHTGRERSRWTLDSSCLAGDASQRVYVWCPLVVDLQ